jgi:hypothetical protein
MVTDTFSPSGNSANSCRSLLSNAKPCQKNAEMTFGGADCPYGHHCSTPIKIKSCPICTSSLLHMYLYVYHCCAQRRRDNFGPVHPAYNPSFLAYFFSQNSIFLSQKISRNSISAGLSAQPNAPNSTSMLVGYSSSLIIGRS